MKETYQEDLFEDPYLQRVYEQLDSMKPGKWYPITKKEQEAAIKTLIDCKLASCRSGCFVFGGFWVY